MIYQLTLWLAKAERAITFAMCLAFIQCVC